MKTLFAFILLLNLFPLAASSQFTPAELARYKAAARRVTIIRDSYGVPHVYGRTDADAVFGLMYAQCEENFEKVERAYIEKLGRRSEIDGETYLVNDLLSQLLYDTTYAKRAYQECSPQMKKLLDAFADG